MKWVKKYVLSPLRGIVSLVLYSLNLLFCLALLLPVLFVGIFIGMQRIKKIYYYLPVFWADNCRRIFNLTGTVLEIKTLGQPEFMLDKYYLVTANHSCWADILVMFNVFNRQIPMLKFFAKRQLIWLPLVGQTAWLYGYPFLHRHSAAELKKHPEWRKKDIESTLKACERFKENPGSLVIYAEGTRFTQAKRKKLESPYQYLLKPKVGGLSMALFAMEERIDTLIDVTIIYPNHSRHNFWDYCCGNLSAITVYVKPVKIPVDLKSSTQTDPEYRQRFQKFIYQLWQEKDELIRAHYHDHETFSER